MNAPSLRLWESIVTGLTILKPYIADYLDIDPIPNSFMNGAPDHSHQCTIGITVGKEEPTEEEIIELKLLGWVFDYPYITLYIPNIYKVPTREEAEKMGDW